MNYSYHTYLKSADDLITTYEARRAGFIALALEKNRFATPFVAEARALQAAAMQVQSPNDLLGQKGIEAGLLTAAGLSDKALTHLTLEDRQTAIEGLIRNFLEPAGDKFVEELVYRFLLTRGDTLGGSMRNFAGVVAQQKLTRSIISTLRVAGIPYRWQDTRLKAKKWFEMPEDDVDIERNLRALSWSYEGGFRTLIYNLKVPFVGNNIDLCVFDCEPETLAAKGIASPELYAALGELKGGIDPAGADEHWKTARSAFNRIKSAFNQAGYKPILFFIGAAIERKMAEEIWGELQDNTLSHAANLTNSQQLALISQWLCFQ
jgi:hypothetical protein